MMDCFIVLVRTSSGRWVDSMFIRQSSALDRVCQIKKSMEGAGRSVSATDHWAYVQPGKIEDAALGDPKPAKKS